MSKINIKSKNKLVLNWKDERKSVRYNYAIKIMEQTVQNIYNKSSSELIWLLEHPSIYTCGTSYKKSDIINITEVPIIETGRGGQITYHGPGQRIIYVMLNLNKRHKDIKRYVKCLESWMIESLKKIGLDSYTSKERIGIWVNTPKGEAKIGAIGIRISRWVTYHGISININPDLSYYKNIIACGLKEFPVTSLKELGFNINSNEFDKIIKKTAKNYF
jgi:lipoyl(octanoyl) transferase